MDKNDTFSAEKPLILPRAQYKKWVPASRVSGLSMPIAAPPPVETTPNSVPVLEGYYSTEEWMTDSQLAFYKELEQKLEKGAYVPVDGQVCYLFVFVRRILATWPKCEPPCSVSWKRGFEEIRQRLDALGAMYQGEASFSNSCIHWSRDCLIACKEFDVFLAVTEPPMPYGNDFGFSQERLNIQHHLGRDGEAVDLFRMVKGRVTDYTTEHPDLFRDLLETCFAEEARTHGPWLPRILKLQGKNLQTYGHDLFCGTGLGPHFPIPFYCFYVPEESQGLIRDCARKAENRLREMMDVPRVGEGWLSETALYHALREAFPETQVIHHGQPKWLARQHFDIWFPDWAVAVEYHGEQHFRPVAFFGGEQAFQETQRRDKLKADLASAHDTRLIVVTGEMSRDAVVSLISAARANRP
ncbi:MAG: hypothetical protein WBL72_22635 [Thermoguttaceae bacterium]